MLLSLAAGARRAFVEARDTKKTPGRSGGLARYLWVRRRSYRRPTVFASRHHQFMKELLSLDIMVAAPFGQSRIHSRATLRRTIAQQSAPRGIFPARFEARARQRTRRPDSARQHGACDARALLLLGIGAEVRELVNDDIEAFRQHSGAEHARVIGYDLAVELHAE